MISCMMESEVLPAVTLKIILFCDATRYNPSDIRWRLEGTRCLHLHGTLLPWRRKQNSPPICWKTNQTTRRLPRRKNSSWFSHVWKYMFSHIPQVKYKVHKETAYFLIVQITNWFTGKSKLIKCSSVHLRISLLGLELTKLFHALLTIVFMYLIVIL